MKNLFLFITFCLLSITTSFATVNTRTDNTPFIFTENNIEYAVFKNGEFDFNEIQTRSSGIHINTSHVNFSFNSGKNYTPNVQVNEYGVITRINNTSIRYNYNGKVKQIGSVVLKYNNYGYVYAIGNLNIRYSDYGRNYYCTGYINNRNLHYKPVYNNYRNFRTPRVAKVYHNKYTPKKKYYNKTAKINYPRKYNTGSKIKKSNYKYVKPNYRKSKIQNTKSYAYRTNSNSYRR